MVRINVTGVGYEPKGNFHRDDEQVNPTSHDGLMLLLKGAALCSDAKLDVEDERWVIRGDATEGALVVVAAEAGIREDELRRYPRVGEVPFTSERKRMTTIHTTPDGDTLAFMKGPQEIVLERCKWVHRNGRVKELTDEGRREV